MLYNYKSSYTSCCLYIFLFVLIRCSSNVYASYYYSFGVNLLLLVCHVMIVRVVSINHVHHTILILSFSLNLVIIDCSICILVLMTYNYIYMTFFIIFFIIIATKAFVKELGHRLRQVTGDEMSHHHLVQRLSVAIQRGNCASVLGTCRSNTPSLFG